MKLTVKNKLLLGFAAVLVVVLAVSLNTYYRIQQTTAIQERLIELRQPTVQAGMRLTNGINLSLAGLRGYMILGSDPEKAEVFKAERAHGWQEIEGAMGVFRDFSKNWTDPANVTRLQEIEVLAKEFSAAQQQVEDIAHANENIPAFNMLIVDAAPRASKVIAAITDMINEEANLAGTDSRKKLLKLLADSRGSFALGLANIRAYLLSGNVEFRDAFRKHWKTNEDRFQQIESMTELFSQKQTKVWQDYKTNRAEFSAYPEKMFALRSARDWNLANHWLGTKAAPKAVRIMEILVEMRTSQDRLAAVDKESLASATRLLTTMMVIGSLIALTIGVIISLSLSRIITEPLKRVVNRAKEVADGNLTGSMLKVSGNDELAELTNSINSMSQSLQNLIMQVSSATSELVAASVQLDKTAENTTQSMGIQRKETEMVATAMNEMSSTIQEVARSASEAAASADQADSDAAEGRGVVMQSMESIHTLAENINVAVDTINKLGENTKGVDDIIEVISAIAEQTNLLALNAAIEAARAGEQGRGFAVVADEVRTLAARTQKSTEEIRTMLGILKTDADEAVKVMDTGYSEAQHCVSQANNANESLVKITDAVTQINDMNAQIATASEEQSMVAEEMNRSIVKVDSESEMALGNTRETSAAAGQVGELAQNLQGLIAKFKVA